MTGMNRQRFTLNTINWMTVLHMGFFTADFLNHFYVKRHVTKKLAKRDIPKETYQKLILFSVIEYFSLFNQNGYLCAGFDPIIIKTDHHPKWKLPEPAVTR